VRDREHIEAVALVSWARMSEARFPELRNLYHIPNGGSRHPAVAGKLKAEGVRKGVSDYHLPVPVPGYIGLWIELKAPGGRATPEQREWIAGMRALGHRAEVAVGWLEAVEIIKNYLEGNECRST